LTHLVRALHPTRCFTRGLDGRKEQADKNADDGDHHQQFHKGKSFGFPNYSVLLGHVPVPIKNKENEVPSCGFVKN
jgi:hypothetical protein